MAEKMAWPSESSGCGRLLALLLYPTGPTLLSLHLLVCVLNQWKWSDLRELLIFHELWTPSNQLCFRISTVLPYLVNVFAFNRIEWSLDLSRTKLRGNVLVFWTPNGAYVLRSQDRTHFCFRPLCT